MVDDAAARPPENVPNDKKDPNIPDCRNVPNGPSGQNGPKLRSKPAETLRVDLGRLDSLMNLAGQLTLDQSRLSRIAGRLRDAVSGCRPAELLACELQDAVETLHRTTRGIRQGATAMRMVSIGPLLLRFHRIVRDVARASGKDIRLMIHGENTHLDKQMIDELGDPLIHAIRNAADHGIEPPEVRIAAGKPRQGTITIDARHRGGSVVLCVSDDGRGIDVEASATKRSSEGFCRPTTQNRMTRPQLLPLAWQPGLSTAETISDVSGRGMGMDIVRSKIEEINGVVEVDSEPGLGTTLRIRLPLTLAILPCLMMEIREEVFAVPLESVAEVVGIGPGDLAAVRGRRVARLRDQIVPIVTLDAVFHGCCGRSEEFDGTLVVLGNEDRQIGLAVDRVLGKEEVVVRSLEKNYCNVAGIAGASILGDGRVALILDPPVLMEMAAEIGGKMQRKKGNRSLVT